MDHGHDPSLEALLNLAHDLGDPAADLAILGEGNVSCALPGGRLLVKASGTTLATLAAGDVTECEAAPLLRLIEDDSGDDGAVEAALLASRVDASAKKPSVEAAFHADLLTLPGVNFVGHVHPVHVLAAVCSGRGEELAGRRLFPDEIVCCGRRSAWVGYVDPGPPLARAVRASVSGFREEHGELPRVVLMGNHGLIALGPTAAAVSAACRMAEKAATVLCASAALGGPAFLSDADVDRIEGRSDEAHRRKALGLI